MDIDEESVYLTTNEEFWMIAFLLAAKKISYNDISNPEFRSLFNKEIIDMNSAEPTCKAICDLITNRTFNFEVAERLIVWNVYKNVATRNWRDIFLTGGECSVFYFHHSLMIRTIAKYCKLHEIYWDDSDKTPEEMEKYKDTDLGGWLWEYNCFISQNLD